MEAIQMKTDVRMISLALAASALISTAVLAAPTEMKSSDGQAQAAALLSREWTPVAPDTQGVASTLASRVEGQVKAAALLSGQQTAGAPISMSRLSQASTDGQARAAALLSRGSI
jgi:hypothetical protein